MSSSTASLRLPDPTPALFAVTLAAVLIWMAGAGWLSLLIVAAALAPFLIHAITARPLFAAGFLVLGAWMPRFYVEIGGIKARPEHIAAGLVLLTIPYWWKKHREQTVWIKADFFLLLYIAANYFSSTFVSTAPAQTDRWATQQLLVILPYFFIRILLTSYQRFRRALELVLLAGVLEAAYALICFYSNRIFGSLLGMEVDQYGNIPGTFGTQLEANILGSTSAACLIMLLTLYFKERKPRFLAGAALAYAGMAISLSRAAVLAAGVALVALVFYALRKKIANAKVVFKAALALSAVTLVLAPTLISLYTERFATVEVQDLAADDNTRVRLLSSMYAYDEILEHPLLGNGTASFQLFHDAKDLGYGDIDQAGWIGNTEIRVLYDMGVVGLATFVLFLWFVLRPAWKLMKREQSSELLALLLATVVYLIAFQFTEGTFLAFSWIHLGLIACGVALLKGREEAVYAPGYLPPAAESRA